MAGLTELGGIIITHPEPEHRSGIVIFILYDDLEKDREVLRRLHAQRIFIAQRFTDYIGGFRVSRHYFTNEKDFDNLFIAIEGIMKDLGPVNYKED